MLEDLAGLVLFGVQLLVLVACGYALAHGAMQRADAYPAAGKMTKNAWMAILGGAVLCALLAFLSGLGITFAAIAAVAAGVYLVDVRPKLLEVQGKSR